MQHDIESLSRAEFETLTPPQKLFHISDYGNIGLFEPRLNDQGFLAPDERAVWGLEESKLAQYLLPRDCPRVCFSPTASGSLSSHAARVIAIESAWFIRAQACRVFLYELPPEPFRLLDGNAGYWISGEAVCPLRFTEITNPLAALVERGVELRVLPSLWPLHDATRDFSMIRMVNAAPRGIEEPPSQDEARRSGAHL